MLSNYNKESVRCKVGMGGICVKMDWERKCKGGICVKAGVKRVREMTVVVWGLMKGEMRD